MNPLEATRAEKKAMIVHKKQQEKAKQHPLLTCRDLREPLANPGCLQRASTLVGLPAPI